MKLLLGVSSLQLIAPTLQQLAITPQPDATYKYLHKATILQHETDIIETGHSVIETTYKVSTLLATKKYHLALLLSIGNSYKSEINEGSVLNIVNDKPADSGMQTPNGWLDLYDLNRLDRNAPPHIRGGFINLTNTYMNVFLPYKKAVGVTVNSLAETSQLEVRQAKYKADCETSNGLGFTYPCLFGNQNFYHLCAINQNLATGTENINLATTNLNHTFSSIIQKL